SSCQMHAAANLNWRLSLRFLNLEAPAAAHLARRRLQHDLEHAMLERCLGAVRNRALRQRYSAVEAAIASLVAVPALPLLFVLLFSLTLDCQHVVVDFNLDVFLPQARQVGADDEIVAALKDFDLRRPRA